MLKTIETKKTTKHIHILPSLREVNRMSAITLKPTIYSECQTVDQVLYKLEHYPKQCTNTPEVFDGFGIEFILFDGPDYGQMVGMLSEFYDTECVHEFFIKTRDGGIIKVERLKNGDFVAIEALDKNNFQLVAEA
jgi:deoxyxylulose-5-phosphate synthase